MLSIYNTLTGRKEPFRELVAGRVGMYVCGMTVYDHIHVGHARSQIAFDVVRRWLRASGYQVNYVRNITDIDDKIINRARELGETVEALTARHIVAMNEDFAALGILPADHEPRATAFMPEIVAMISTLISKGNAYVGTSGDVLYSVSSFKSYGQLSGKKLADLRAGSRVEVDEKKRDPLDFVLWKRAKPGEPSWDSPWGLGRPGWHIECSAMAVALLGDYFDIHGGGMDLKFPHHENELAQTCAARGTPFVHVWMHNGFVRVNDEKMSKSLGNFFTVREVLPRLRPEVLRAFVLASHYRGPINYGEENLRQADSALQRLYLALRDVTPAVGFEPSEATRRFSEAMNDDFNTPDALAAMQSLARELNVAKSAGDSEAATAFAAELRALGAILGLLEQPPGEWLATHSELTGTVENAASRPDPTEIDRLVAARTEARRTRNWAESDRIRDELAGHGVVLEDGPVGTSWRWQ